MNESQERMRSRRLSEKMLLALSFATLVSVLLVLLPARSAFALPSPKADYRLQNTLTTSVGTAPELQKIGPKTNAFSTATVDDSSRKVLTSTRSSSVMPPR